MKYLTQWICCFFLGVFALSACDNEGPQTSDTFIACYILIDDIGCEYDNANNSITFGFLGERITKTTDKKKFTELSNRYGDAGYNKVLHRIPIYSSPRPYDAHTVVADEILSIDVVSDKDFGSCPAGSSLKEIAVFYGLTAYPFVSSKYQAVFSWAPDKEDDFLLNSLHTPAFRWFFFEGYTPIKQGLWEMTEEMKLLGWVARIQFTEAPVPGDYTFTLTFQTKDKVIPVSFSAKVYSISQNSPTASPVLP